MNYWITVSHGEYFACSVPVAHTDDPALVRQVLVGLCENRNLEADGRDRIADPEFHACALAAIAALDAMIRRDARLLWTDESTEGPPDQDSPAQGGLAGGADGPTNA